MQTETTDAPLPHGAKKIKMGDATLILANDKVVFSVKGDKHLTLHIGSYSQCLDIHETTRRAGSTDEHTTLFSITHEKLALVFKDLEPVVGASLRKMLRPLRPGWMARQRIRAILGLLPDGAGLAEVTAKRGGTLMLDEEKLAARANALEWVDELYGLPDGQPFTLFSCSKAEPKMIGIGFKYCDEIGVAHLKWLRFGKIDAAADGLRSALRDAAYKYGKFHRPLPWL